MVKNKVLTPVLAGVLGLSIVGSGLGYYFVNKDSNDGKTEGGKAKLTQVADNINNTLGTAEKAIKGELDLASQRRQVSAYSLFLLQLLQSRREATLQQMFR